MGDDLHNALPILPAAWSAFVMHPELWPPVRARLCPGGVVVSNSTLLGAGVKVPGVRVGSASWRC